MFAQESVMEIQKIPTLAEKQEFWAEQLPNFKAKYWLPSHFKFVAFDMEQGNFDIKDGLDPSFEDDAVEIWHRVNTGWAMWKKAINFGRKQAQSVPESFEQAYSEIFSPIVKRPYPRLENGDYKYIEIDQGRKLWQAAKAQAVPEGFVLVEKKEFEQMQEFEDLYRRAIFNSKKSIHEVNWSHVSNLGVGSTRAKAMCKRFNIDPEATFRKPQEPTND